MHVVRIVLGLILLAIVLLLLFPIARMGWRFFKGDVEMESGGSFGKQFFGRDDKKDRM